ncbi:MAG: hypothetical protein R3A52_14370 [Polyangiales bacterium]
MATASAAAVASSRREAPARGRPGELRHHGLEVQEGFETSLGDLGLVGGVLGVPAGVFEDVPLDDRGGDGVAVAAADEGPVDLAVLGLPREGLEEQVLAADLVVVAEVRGVEGEGGAEPDGLRHGLGDEGVEGAEAEGGEHLGDFAVVRADVAANEGV